METYQFDFKKSLGQNFLKDVNLVQKIVKSADIQGNSLVIEIGPGAGIMTKELGKVATQVLAFEIDRRLENFLDYELKDYSNIEIIYDDFLNRDLQEDLKKFQYDNLYVVSNLPYYITTPIITKLIEEKIQVQKIVVMVQKEVGNRFTAKPKTKEYNSLTVFLNYHFDIQKLFTVSRELFVPKPNVDSLVVSLEKKKSQLPVDNEVFFFQIVRDSFKYKRKTLRNNLKNYDLIKIEQVLSQYHMDLSARAEQLPLEIFVEISNALSG